MAVHVAMYDEIVAATGICANGRLCRCRTSTAKAGLKALQLTERPDHEGDGRRRLAVARNTQATTLRSGDFSRHERSVGSLDGDSDIYGIRALKSCRRARTLVLFACRSSRPRVGSARRDDLDGAARQTGALAWPPRLN
jgi:hypothetical protein